ncbi:Ribulose-phosphate 3-epimerase [hydrothermal vent metagenome]|uniref:ribulose-phosphate 3-epimerase n=1 Tax=hydrothermal vent metagenome TaxID=652676 RepID=A0A3B0QNT6_9ZZZZ
MEVKRMKISPSILSADFTRLGEEIRAVTEAGADYIHIDVMDGHFVPNITIGPLLVEAARRATELPLDVHLMIERPERYIEDFAKAGSDIITIHAEATPHLHRAVQAIKECGLNAGLAINPSTPASAIEPLAGYIDMALVMSVNPGFGGQRFIDSALEKIRRVRIILDSANSAAELQVDGGIKVSNIAAAAEAGADVFVAGSAVFGSDDYKKTIEDMRRELGQATV